MLPYVAMMPCASLRVTDRHQTRRGIRVAMALRHRRFGRNRAVPKKRWISRPPPFAVLPPRNRQNSRGSRFVGTRTGQVSPDVSRGSPPRGVSGLPGAGAVVRQDAHPRFVGGHLLHRRSGRLLNFPGRDPQRAFGPGSAARRRWCRSAGSRWRSRWRWPPRRCRCRAR
jgi:hypothetical protein